MALEFWQGTNGIGGSKKSDLTISNTAPGNMVVRSTTTGDVFVGSSMTGSVLVEKATTADDYASWTGITGSLSATKAIRGLSST